MKKLFCIVCLGMLLVASNVMAGEIRLGGSDQYAGHSNKQNYCVDDGAAFEIGYDHNIFNYYVNSWLGFDLDIGPELILSRYDTAKRERVGDPRYHKRTHTSVNLSGIIKPTINVWRFSAYYMLGGGADWMEMENDHMSLSYTQGNGIDFRITDNVSIGYSEKRVDREDTGFYKYKTILVKIKM